MNNDLISREALKKAFEITQYNNYDDLKRTESLIDNAPTVDLTKNQAYDKGFITAMKLYARPQGEWIVLVDADNIQTCKCSICGRMVDIGNREFDKFPYCHCGAKMKGGKEE